MKLKVNQEGKIELHRFLNKITLGDSYKLIKQIPDNSVDLIIIDPPYEIETEGGNTKIGQQIRKNMLKELKDLNITEGIDYSLLDELCRVMKRINIYIWCNKKQILEYLKYFVENKKCSFEILTWIKNDAMPLCRG